MTKAAPANARKSAAPDVPNLFRINIEVGNLDEAADFYAHLLAQPGRKQAGSRCYFNAGPVTLQVVDVSSAGNPHPAAKALYFTVKDLDAIFARAKAGATDILARYRAGAPEADFATHVHATYPGLVRDLDSPAVRLACALSGSNDVHTVAYGTEAGLFQEAGIPAVVCGPGSIDKAHRADEFVPLDQLESCTVFLRRLAQRATQ